MLRYNGVRVMHMEPSARTALYNCVRRVQLSTSADAYV